MKESVQIIRFMIVGTSNAVIAAGVIWLMMEVCGCDYRLSNIVGYIASLINNFFWSKYWIFNAPGHRFMREVPLFLLAFGFAYLMQFLSLWSSWDCMNIWPSSWVCLSMERSIS